MESEPDAEDLPVREKYAALSGEPWFDLLCEYWDVSSDRDDERTMDLIEDALERCVEKYGTKKES